MNKWYNEKTDLITVERLFNDIILSKFEKEYNKLIKFDFHNYNDYSNYNKHSNNITRLVYSIQMM